MNTVFEGRADAAEPVRRWTLGERSLSVELAGGRIERELDYDEIAELRLRHAGTRLQRARWACCVRPRVGPELEFVSQAWLGLAQFGDRGTAYAAFVEELVRRVAAANPQARFLAGRPARLLRLELAVFGAVVAVNVMFPELLGIDSSTQGWLWAVYALALALLLGNWVRKNRPQPFDPRAIPARLLPPPRSA